ncbi:MAG: hypothetical protein WCK63_14220, partial [Betaproteobacteria bacterium]
MLKTIVKAFDLITRQVKFCLALAMLCVVFGCAPLPQNNTATEMDTLYAHGLAAYSSKDYAASLIVFRQLADRGYAPAQYNLGVMYDNGHGV